MSLNSLFSAIQDVNNSSLDNEGGSCGKTSKANDESFPEDKPLYKQSKESIIPPLEVFIRIEFFAFCL